MSSIVAERRARALALEHAGALPRLEGFVPRLAQAPQDRPIEISECRGLDPIGQRTVQKLRRPSSGLEPDALSRRWPAGCKTDERFGVLSHRQSSDRRVSGRGDPRAVRRSRSRFARRVSVRNSTRLARGRRNRAGSRVKRQQRNRDQQGDLRQADELQRVQAMGGGEGERIPRRIEEGGHDRVQASEPVIYRRSEIRHGRGRLLSSRWSLAGTNPERRRTARSSPAARASASARP